MCRAGNRCAAGREAVDLRASEERSVPSPSPWWRWPPQRHRRRLRPSGSRACPRPPRWSNCPSQIFGSPYTEIGLGARADVLLDAADLPTVGEVFYARVGLAAVGNPLCGDPQGVYVEVYPPVGVSLAIGPGTPVRCIRYTGPTPSPEPECPQVTGPRPARRARAVPSAGHRAMAGHPGRGARDRGAPALGAARPARPPVLPAPGPRWPVSRRSSRAITSSSSSAWPTATSARSCRRRSA